MKISTMLVFASAMVLQLVGVFDVYATTYTYDPLNRLTQVTYDNGSSLNYTYDAAGNITNIAKTASSQFADLVPTAINVTGSIANGSVVTVDVTVQNQGNLPSVGVPIRYYYSPNLNGQDNEYVYSNRYIPDLNPGESFTVSTNLNFVDLQKGTSYLVARIDTLNSANELDASNNAISYTINYTDTTPPNISYFALQGSSNGQYRTYNQYFISFTALDDISVSGVSFAYSTDNGSSWNTIDSAFQVISNGGGNGFYWTIPGSVPLNNAFMLRITSSDSSGNSSSKTIGPYTIIDGSTPAVTITSPAKGVVWKLGETRNITWSASSPNGIKKVRISHSSGGPIVDLPSNTGSYSWTIPNSASYASNNATINIYVEDNNGNGLWVQSEEFQTVDASAPPLPPWGVPERITTVSSIDGHTQNYNLPAIVVDSQGNQHVVYLYQDDNLSSSRVIIDKLMYTKKTGSTWSTPVVLKTLNNGPSTTGIDSFVFFNDPSVKVDNNNRPHVTWKELSNTLNNVYYSYYNGSSWSSPALVSNNPSKKLKLIVNNNEVDFFWIENISGLTRQVFTRKFNFSTGIWGAASKITDTHNDENYDVAIVGTTTHVAYTYRTDINRIGYTSNNGSGWSAQQELVPAFNNYKIYEDLNIFADLQGRIHLAGLTRDATTIATRIIFYSLLEGGTWSALNKALESAESIIKVQVNSDSSGTPNLLFTDSTAATIKYFQSTGAGTWSPSTTAILSSQTLGSYELKSAANPAMNKLYLPYIGYFSGHWEVYVNTADLTADILPPTISISGISSGQIVNAGSVVPITWAASDDKSVSSVTLKYSTDGGGTFTTIATSLSASGTFQWTVPAISTNNALIVAEALDSANNQGSTNSPLFTINYTPSYTLSISRSGAGSGSVSSTPAAINCGNVCSATYTTPTQLMINAIADQYSIFTGWSGECNGTDACTIDVTADKAVVATFANNSNSLTVSVVGSGTGRVTSVPAGISCTSGSCISRYVTNSSVTLTPSPDADVTFTGWTGDCTGTGLCTVTLDSVKSVTANFNKIVVASSFAGKGGAIEPPSASGISQLTATFTVTADPGYVITSITGCGGTLNGNTYTTGTVTTDCRVTAFFSLPGSEAQLNGEYHFLSQMAGLTVDAVPAVRTIAEGNSGSITFDGAGGCSIAATHVSVQETSDGIMTSPSAETFACRYAGDGAGTFLLFTDTEPIFKGYFGADGNLFTSLDASEDDGPGGAYRIDQLIGVKTGSGMSSATLNGTYSIVAQENSLRGTSPVSKTAYLADGVLTFNGIGGCTVNLSGISIEPSGNSISTFPETIAETCSYVLDATGHLSASINGDEAFSGTVSADGGAILIGGYSQNDDGGSTGHAIEQTVAIRTGSNKSVSSLNGAYGFTMQDFRFSQENEGTVQRGLNGQSGILTFDGAGICSYGHYDAKIREEGTDTFLSWSTGSDSCTYSVSSAGDLSVSFGNGGFDARLAADDGSFIAGNSYADGDYGVVQLVAVKTAAMLSNRNISVTMAGSGSGTINSKLNGASASFTCGTGICSTSFPSGSTLALFATPDWKSFFSGWSGGCSGSSSCSINLTADTGVTALFTSNPKVKLSGATTIHASLQEAYNAANTGETMLLQVYTFPENLYFNLPKNVKLNGGMDTNYAATGGATIIDGVMRISRGTVKVRNIVIR